MSYDFDSASDHSCPIVTNHVPDPSDLEVIVLLLELAALNLTLAPDADFTFDQLLAEAHVIGGAECLIDRRDAAIVLSNSSLMKKTTRGRLCLA